MNDLVLLKVTNGGNMLDHSPMATWPVFTDGNSVDSVFIILGNRQLKLRSVKCYNRRGGINNAEMGRWIKARYGSTRGVILLFEADYNRAENAIRYKLIGRVDLV